MSGIMDVQLITAHGLRFDQGFAGTVHRQRGWFAGQADAVTKTGGDDKFRPGFIQTKRMLTHGAADGFCQARSGQRRNGGHQDAEEIRGKAADQIFTA